MGDVFLLKAFLRQWTISFSVVQERSKWLVCDDVRQELSHGGRDKAGPCYSKDKRKVYSPDAT